jgi:DNA repair exonuclease SbcCD ATPase subunit
LRIRRLHLREFGRLRGEFHFAADRINLILEPNESGKSTLAAAIVAGLYGFPQGQRRSEGRPIPEIDIHRPWSGADYVVEMDLEADGRVYTVRRNFGRKEEKVYEWRTGKEITGEFLVGKEDLDFGGRLTGVGREDFARSVFLRQSEMREVRDAAGITAALQRIATSQQGDVAASEAMETLRGAIRQYRGRKIRRGKIESEISEIDDEIHGLSERMEAMESRRRAAEARIRELETVAGEEGRIGSHLQRLEYLVLAAGRREDATRLEEETAERSELEEREREFQSLAPFSEFPAQDLTRILEIKGRLQEISREEERIRERAAAEIDVPLRILEEKAAAAGALASLSPMDLSRFSTAETELAAACKARRDARRSLAALAAGWKRKGLDPIRLRSLSEKFGRLRPDDRRFLLACGERQVSAVSAISEAERESSRIDSELAEVDSRTRRNLALRNVLAAAGAGLAIAAVSIFLSRLPHVWAYASVIGAGAALIVRSALQPSGASDTALASLRAEHGVLSRTLEDKRREADEIQSRLDSLALQAGYESGDLFLEEFREAESHQDQTAEHSSFLRRLNESQALLREAATTIGAVMKAGGHRPRFGAVTPRTSRRFRLLAASHRETLSQIEEMADRRRSAERQTAVLSQGRGTHLCEVASILEAAGIEPTEDLDGALESYREAIERRERYEALKRDVIPALVRRSISHRGDSLKRSVEVADSVLRRRVTEDPTLAGLNPERSHKEYVEERNRMQQESRSLAERRLQLSADLSEVLREYRKEYPDALRWLREWQEVRERAAAFKSAIEIACEALEVLSREAYAEWADVLNERASEALTFLSPGYDDLRFDEDLSFTVRDTSDGTRRNRDDVDHRLSAGARDQIYLAGRLAMADYLSSGRVKLPLILDDPFATFDDERFARAMGLIIDKFGRRHQVILLSCHEARHRAWQEREPERFAERVRVMSLQAPVS